MKYSFAFIILTLSMNLFAKCELQQGELPSQEISGSESFCRGTFSDPSCITIIEDRKYVEKEDARGVNLKLSIYEGVSLLNIDMPTLKDHLKAELYLKYNDTKAVTYSIGDVKITCNNETK